MLKDPECAARYEESMHALEATQAPYEPVTVMTCSWQSQPVQPSHASLVWLQEALATLPQVELPPKHWFAPGMYGRELPIPADTMVVGKIHKHQHFTFLLSGECTINTDKGMERITGPHIWVSQENAKRALYTHTDCVFFTVHATNETDLDALEAELIEPETLALTAQGVLS